MLRALISRSACHMLALSGALGRFPVLSWSFFLSGALWRCPGRSLALSVALWRFFAHSRFLALSVALCCAFSRSLEISVALWCSLWLSGAL